LERKILEDFLIGHKAEVKDVCLTEYNEVKVQNALREEGVDEGEERMSILYKFLRENNRLDEWDRSTSDRDLRKKLLSELPDDWS
jgi:hypothetical protein